MARDQLLIVGEHDAVLPAKVTTGLGELPEHSASQKEFINCATCVYSLDI